jgi:hypothetical protein
MVWLAGAVAATAAVVEVERRSLRDWGSTAEERTRPLPGEDLVAGPTDAVTLAVGVDAPADKVWRWLVQIGADRGGWYSYDRLENLFGLGIHSADEIRPELQDLAVGDRVMMIRRGWMGLADGFGLPIAVLDPPRALVLREDPAETPWDAVWTFAIEADGADRCRLLSRTRTHRAPGAGAAVARVLGRPMDLVTLVMTRRMLLGIAERAGCHAIHDPAR